MILQKLGHSTGGELTFALIFTALITSFIMAYIVSYVYRKTHTGFSYENSITDNLYFGSNLNLGYTETTVSEDALISSVDPLITSQYVIGLVEKNNTRLARYILYTS